MQQGDMMWCDLIYESQPIGKQTLVTIGKIKRDHMTQKPQSVHVTFDTNKGKRSVWVQPQYLHAQES